MHKLRWPLGLLAALLPALLLVCGMGPAGALALLSGGGMFASYDFTTSIPGGFTFSRSGSRTCYTGTALTTLSAGVPCIEPAGGPMNGYGLLLEPGTTNGVRNNVAAGATNGAMGGGGAAPTYWTVAGITGVTATIIGNGYESGIPYEDVQFSGTPSSTGAANIYTESTAAIAASAAQIWTSSHFLSVQSGSMTNISLTQCIENAGATETSGSVITPVSGTLISQRFAATETAPTGTTSVYARLRFGMTSGQAVNVTIRVGGAQMEQLPWASSLLVTSGSAVVRQPDALSLVPPSWLQSVGGFTIALDFDLIPAPASVPTFGIIDIYSAGSNSDYVVENSGGGGPYGYKQVAGTINGASYAGSPLVTGNNKVVLADNGLGTEYISANGGNPGSITQAGYPAFTNISFGSMGGTGSFAPIHAHRVRLWGSLLNSAAMSAATR